MSISRWTHSMKILAETNTVAIIEIVPDDAPPPEGRFYVVEIDREKQQVLSLLPQDRPPQGGYYIGRISEGGVSYVAKPLSFNDAAREFNSRVASDFLLTIG